MLGYLYVLLFENQVSLSYCPRQNIQTSGLDFLPAENGFFTSGKYLQTGEILEDQFASRREWVELLL